MSHDAGDDAVWSRRDFVSTTALGVLGLSGATRQGRASETMAYVGTYTTDGRSEGIYILRMHAETGALSLQGVAAKAVNPSFLALHPHGRVLYAVNEVAEFAGRPSGAVSAFAIDAASGSLRPLGQQSSEGKAPCYVSLDRGGRFVFVANYTGGSVATLPIGPDGWLRVARSVVRHEGSGADPARQASAHPHCILSDPNDRHVLVVDLGTDAVLSYRLDDRTGMLSPVEPGAAMRAGAGPRHLAFHPGGRLAYVVNELDSTVTAFSYDPDRGALEEIETTAASPGGSVPNNHPADVHVAASGRFLYLSNRGDDTIAVFSIDGATGRLTLVQEVPTGGRWPRNFALDPTGRFLLVANQRSDSIVGFRVDADSGRLTPTGHRVEVATPVCVRFR